MSEDNNSGATSASSSWIDSLRRISWGILSLLGLIVVLGTIFTAQFARSQRDTALRVNVAGRQRMLSQKIAFLAGQLLGESNAAKRPPLLAELRESITAVEKSHRGLIDGDAELGLRPGRNPDVRARYHDGSPPLDAVVISYLNHARAITQYAPTDPRAQAAFAEIRNDRLPLLSALDELVTDMENAGRRGVRWIEIAVYANSGVMVALILFLTIRVYQRLLHRVRSQFDALRQLNEELEDRVAERTRELALNERAFAAARNGIVITDAQNDNEVIYCNAAICHTLRCGAKDILGRNMRFIQGKDTDPKSLRTIRQAVRDGRECSVTLLNYRCDGEAFWNEIIISPVRDERGELTHFIGIQSDVTGRRRLEEKLEWSRESFALAVEGAQLGIWHWDIQNNSLEWSDRCREIFAVPLNEPMSYERFLAAVHPDDREQVDRDVRQTLENRTQYEVEFRTLWPDGSVRWIAALGRGYDDDSGAAVRMEGVVEDITAKKVIRTRLESREAGIRRLHEATAATADFEEAARNALTAGCEIFDLEMGLLSFVVEGRCVIQHAHEPFAPEFSPGEEVPLGDALRSTVLKQNAPLLFHRADETKWAAHPACQKYGIQSFSAAPIRTHSSVCGVVSFYGRQARARPFTEADADLAALLAVWVGNALEYHRNQSRLQAARDEADRANQAKSEFLSRMSHELRTPLNGILGFAQLLQIANLPERQKRSAQHINKAGRHLLDLINEVLDLARVESGQLTTSLEPVNLLEAIRDVEDLLKPQADQRNITIELATRETDPNLLVLADCQRVKQVLLNLGGNGIKYNREGGRLAFDWERRSGSVVRVNVRDTGPGIPVDMRERIFIPFERGGAEQTEVEGTGLGLTLTKRLIDAMNGRIGLDSEEGAGSCFWFELTEASRERIREGDLADTTFLEKPEADGRPVTVLYIEDNLENVRLIEEVLALRPHVQLVTAMQASVGLQLALDRQPELIFLDLHLPDENGDQVLKKLKANSRTRHIPVIMLTADAMRRQEKRLLAAGAREYVTKPIEVQRILNLLDTLPTERKNGS